MTEIFIPLIGEGTRVWRPAQAHEVSANVFRIDREATISADESWSFAPGDVVRCERRRLSDGPVVWVAVAHESTGRAYSMVQECTDQYSVTARDDGSLEIRLSVPARFAELWQTRLSELRTTDSEIASYAPDTG